VRARWLAEVRRRLRAATRAQRRERLGSSESGRDGVVRALQGHVELSLPRLSRGVQARQS